MPTGHANNNINNKFQFDTNVESPLFFLFRPLLQFVHLNRTIDHEKYSASFVYEQHPIATSSRIKKDKQPISKILLHHAQIRVKGRGYIIYTEEPGIDNMWMFFINRGTK